MTDAEKIAMLKAMVDETSDDVCSTYLKIAGNKVCRKAYPFNGEISTVPEKYEIIQIEIAAYLLNKRGAEGEVAHKENGISRTYEDGDIPPTLLRDITPCACVVGSPEPAEEDTDPEPDEDPVPASDDTVPETNDTTPESGDTVSESGDTVTEPTDDGDPETNEESGE